MKRSIIHGDKSQNKKRRVIFDSRTRGSSSEKNNASKGELISQTLNQLNDLEQSRYEAFTRCTFSSDSLSKFIAACLIHSKDQSSHHRINHLHLIGSGDRVGVNNNFNGIVPGDNHNTTNRSIRGGSVSLNQNLQTYFPASDMPTPSLSDLVAPGSASKITSVVTTLAKIHAQRLMQSARSIATAQGYGTDQKILPHHLMEAHRVRVKYGSGFFMQPPNDYQLFSNQNSTGTSCSLDSNFSAAFGMMDKNRIQFEAALQAQETYDKIIQESTNQSIHDKEIRNYTKKSEDDIIEGKND